MSRSRPIPILFLLFVLLFAFAASAAGPVPVHLVGVSDGDTIKVLMHGRQVKVRLHGIDAPEKGQPYGQAATRAMKHLVSGHAVTIQAMDTDRYGRTVALVFADGVNLNAEMIRAGYAWVYPQYCRQSFCHDWRRLQEAARHARSGLWHDHSPIPPWEWRRESR